MTEAQVIEALRVLNSATSDASEREVVSNYLRSFQRSLLSWNVTLNLLSRTGEGLADAQIFAALTLKDKLRTQSWQLSAESWEPIRACIVALLQRPQISPPLLKQASLCLVAMLLMLNAVDDTCLQQLRSVISTQRLLTVVRLLGEEVSSDAKLYESRPGVDKLACWMQLRQSVSAMAPAVIGWLQETSTEVKQVGAIGSQVLEQVQVDTLECASVWVQLAVLQAVPPDCCRGLLEVAMDGCLSSYGPLVTAACETVSHAVERCPDDIVPCLQDRMLEVGRRATLVPLAAGADVAPVQAMASLFCGYVQSCVDDLAQGGPAAQAFVETCFKMVAMGAQAGTEGHVLVVPALEAVLAVGTALQGLVQQADGHSGLPAGAYELLRRFVQGSIGLLPAFQAALLQRHASPGVTDTDVTVDLHLDCQCATKALVGWADYLRALASAAPAPAGPAQAAQAAAVVCLQALSAAPSALSMSPPDDAAAAALADAEDADAGGLRLQAWAVNDEQREAAFIAVELLERCQSALVALGADAGAEGAALRWALLGGTRVVAPLLVGLWDAAVAQRNADWASRIEVCLDAAFKLVPVVASEAIAAEGSMDVDAESGGASSAGQARKAPHGHLLLEQQAGALCVQQVLTLLSTVATPGAPLLFRRLVANVLPLLHQCGLPASMERPVLAGVFASVRVVSQEGDPTSGPADVAALRSMEHELVQALVAGEGGTQPPVDPEAAMAEGMAPRADVGAAGALLPDQLRRTTALLQQLRSLSESSGAGQPRGDAEAAAAAGVEARVNALLDAVLPVLEPGLVALVAAPGEGPARALAAAAGALEALVRLHPGRAQRCVGAACDMLTMAASLEVLVDWHRMVAAAMLAYMPRNHGDARMATLLLHVLQRFWALPELQALSCPGEADIVPDASLAALALCRALASSTMPMTSWLSTEALMPLVEAGMARCAMCSAANQKHIAQAGLASLLAMLNATAHMPASSLALISGCVLRCCGTIMIGFAGALAAPSASHRLHKMSQLLVQLAALVARAVPLVGPTFMPALQGPLPCFMHTSASLVHPLTAAEINQGVSFVLGWLKHAMLCLQPGTLKSVSPDAVCSAVQEPLRAAVSQGVSLGGSLSMSSLRLSPSRERVVASDGGADASGGADGSMAAPLSPAGPPSLASRRSGSGLGSPGWDVLGGATPFVGLPAALTKPGAAGLNPRMMRSGLGVGAPFGGAMHVNQPFAVQLSPHMLSSAVGAGGGVQQCLHTISPFDLSAALASRPCRMLKKALRSVVDALAMTQTNPTYGAVATASPHMAYLGAQALQPPSVSMLPGTSLPTPLPTPLSSAVHAAAISVPTMVSQPHFSVPLATYSHPAVPVATSVVPGMYGAPALGAQALPPALHPSVAMPQAFLSPPSAQALQHVGTWPQHSVQPGMPLGPEQLAASMPTPLACPGGLGALGAMPAVSGVVGQPFGQHVFPMASGGDVLSTAPEPLAAQVLVSGAHASPPAGAVHPAVAADVAPGSPGVSHMHSKMSGQS